MNSFMTSRITTICFIACAVLSAQGQVAAQPQTHSLDQSVQAVGLFVDQSVDEILELCSKTGIETIQLHNDHTLEFVAELRKLDPSKELIYVYRLGSAGFRPLANFV